MTLTQHAPPRIHVTRGAKRFGYAVGIGINIVLIFVVNNLLNWEFPSFLTADFEQVLPALNVSLIAGIVVNLLYLTYDDAWFKSLTQAALSVIALVVVVRTLSVFPFDFTPYDFDWEILSRTVMVFMIVALSIAVIGETIKGVSALLAGRPQQR